jgi:hypothetical protein
MGVDFWAKNSYELLLTKEPVTCPYSNVQNDALSGRNLNCPVGINSITLENAASKLCDYISLSWQQGYNQAVQLNFHPDRHAQA